MLPDSEADFIIHYDARSYSGQFSEDGNFFYSCSQDFRVRMYDTSNPYEWKYYKTVDYIGGRWTITDACLSPDNRYLAYSSITSRVFLANTSPGDGEMIPLEFSHGIGRGRNRNAMDFRYGVKFIYLKSTNNSGLTHGLSYRFGQSDSLETVVKSSLGRVTTVSMCTT